MGVFSGSGRKPKAAPVACLTCGEHMDESWGKWDRTPPVPFHCNGSPVAFAAHTTPNPHHSRRKYPRCWKCDTEMGCSKCAGPEDQVLCTRCVVWTTKAAFAAHGPILNTEVMLAKRAGKRAPGFDEYSSAFRYAYSAAQQDAPAPTGSVKPELDKVIRANLD